MSDNRWLMLIFFLLLWREERIATAMVPTGVLAN